MYLVQVNQSLKCFGRRSVGFDTFGRVHQIFLVLAVFVAMLPGLIRTGWVFVGFQWIFLVLAVFVACCRV